MLQRSCARALLGGLPMRFSYGVGEGLDGWTLISSYDTQSGLMLRGI